MIGWHPDNRRGQKKGQADSLRPRNNQQAAHPRAPTFANVGKYPPDPPLPALSFDEHPFTFYITVIVCSYGIPSSSRFPCRHSTNQFRVELCPEPSTLIFPGRISLIPQPATL